MKKTEEKRKEKADWYLEIIYFVLDVMCLHFGGDVMYWSVQVIVRSCWVQAEMFLGLIYKALKSDVDTRRISAFAKRLIQVRISSIESKMLDLKC